MIDRVGALRLAILVAALLVGSTGCDEEFLVDPLDLCRCSPDELCVDEACVPLGELVLTSEAEPLPEGCVIADTRINELRHSGRDLPDFVELIGEPGASVDGYYLQAYEASGARRTIVELIGTLDENGLWTASFGSGLESDPSIDYGAISVLGLASPAGSLELYSCDGTVLDAVAWGEFGADDVPLGEGAVTGAAATDKALRRCPGDGLDAIDSQDNETDFVAGEATPGAVNTSCAPCDPSAIRGNVWIAEVLYDPTGPDPDGDAFVELRGTAGTSLEGVTISSWDETTGTFGAAIELDGSIDINGFFLIAESSSVAGVDQVVDSIDSANDAGGFSLVACGNAVLDVVGYGALADPAALGLTGEPASDVDDGRSLARCPDGDASGELVSAEPTAGEPNICQ